MLGSAKLSNPLKCRAPTTGNEVLGRGKTVAPDDRILPRRLHLFGYAPRWIWVRIIPSRTHEASALGALPLRGVGSLDIEEFSSNFHPRAATLLPTSMLEKRRDYFSPILEVCKSSSCLYRPGAPFLGYDAALMSGSKVGISKGF